MACAFSEYCEYLCHNWRTQTILSTREPGAGQLQRNYAFFFFFINEGVCPMGLVEMKPEIARFVLLGDRGQADKQTRQTRLDRDCSVLSLCSKFYAEQVNCKSALCGLDGYFIPQKSFWTHQYEATIGGHQRFCLL